MIKTSYFFLALIISLIDFGFGLSLRLPTYLKKDNFNPMTVLEILISSVNIFSKVILIV